MMENEIVQVDKKGISGSTLKLIAIITMLIDHIGASMIEVGILGKYQYDTVEELTNMLLNNQFVRNMYMVDGVMRLIGRLGFPIFCFLLVEGFLHTHDVKRYALRLLAFCFISEIPFDMAFKGSFFNMSHQNVFFTLFIGLLVMVGMRKVQTLPMKKWINIVAQIAVVIVGMGVAQILKTDYAAFGVFFIVVLYVFHDKELWRNIVGCISICWEVTAPLAFIFMHFYNGKRGLNLKYVFYLFYPVHLLILGLITMFLL